MKVARYREEIQERRRPQIATGSSEHGVGDATQAAMVANDLFAQAQAHYQQQQLQRIVASQPWTNQHSHSLSYDSFVQMQVGYPVSACGYGESMMGVGCLYGVTEDGWTPQMQTVVY